MDTKKLKEVLDKIDEYDDAYYNHHKKIVSDPEYDGIKDSLKILIKGFKPSGPSEEKLLIRSNDALSRIGAPPPKDGKWPKVKHEVAMQSLNKCNTFLELQDWYKKIQK